MNFYVTLPSHSNRKEFPENTNNNFTVQLSKPIVLPGKGWTVGLVDLQFPKVLGSKLDQTHFSYDIKYEKQFWEYENEEVEMGFTQEIDKGRVSINIPEANVVSFQKTDNILAVELKNGYTIRLIQLETYSPLYELNNSVTQHLAKTINTDTCVYDVPINSTGKMQLRYFLRKQKIGINQFNEDCSKAFALKEMKDEEDNVIFKYQLIKQQQKLILAISFKSNIALKIKYDEDTTILFKHKNNDFYLQLHEFVKAHPIVEFTLLDLAPKKKVVHFLKEHHTFLSLKDMNKKLKKHGCSLVSNKLKIAEKVEFIPNEYLKQHLTLNESVYGKGEYPIQVSKQFMKIEAYHIYIDIIEYQYVGNSFTPLLRSITYKSNEPMAQQFNPAFYLPLVRSNFQTIEVDIRSDKGLQIDFDPKQTTQLVLHFKKQ